LGENTTAVFGYRNRNCSLSPHFLKENLTFLDRSDGRLLISHTTVGKAMNGLRRREMPSASKVWIWITMLHL
jgi:hypothetical protein